MVYSSYASMQNGFVIVQPKGRPNTIMGQPRYSQNTHAAQSEEIRSHETITTQSPHETISALTFVVVTAMVAHHDTTIIRAEYSRPSESCHCHVHCHDTIF